MTVWLSAMWSFLLFYAAAGRQAILWAPEPARATTPLHALRKFEPGTSSNFGGSTMDKNQLYIAFHKNIFNPPNGWAVYLLSLAPESDGKGVSV